MHLEKTGRILEECVKQLATLSVLHASLVFSQHFPRALFKITKNQRDSFSFLKQDLEIQSIQRPHVKVPRSLVIFLIKRRPPLNGNFYLAATAIFEQSQAMFFLLIITSIEWSASFSHHELTKLL